MYFLFGHRNTSLSTALWKRMWHKYCSTETPGRLTALTDAQSTFIFPPSKEMEKGQKILIKYSGHAFRITTKLEKMEMQVRYKINYDTTSQLLRIVEQRTQISIDKNDNNACGRRILFISRCGHGFSLDQHSEYMEYDVSIISLFWIDCRL
jgi:hypothetical protein